MYLLSKKKIMEQCASLYIKLVKNNYKILFVTQNLKTIIQNVFFLQRIFSVRVTTLENLNSNYEQTIITINDKAYVVLSLAPLESLLRSVCLYTNIHKYTYYVR
jgi:hypothetical protein